jgi:hypothetical protein
MPERLPDLDERGKHVRAIPRFWSKCGKHSSASQERLVVGTEPLGEVAGDLGGHPVLVADPLQQW